MDSQILGKDHADVATIKRKLGVLYATQGKYDEAESLYEEALETDKMALDKDDPRTKKVVEDYAELLRRTARGDEAARLENEFRTK